MPTPSIPRGTIAIDDVITDTATGELEDPTGHLVLTVTDPDLRNHALEPRQLGKGRWTAEYDAQLVGIHDVIVEEMLEDGRVRSMGRTRFMVTA